MSADAAAHYLRAGTLQLPAQPPLSLYLHLPWCIRKCPYCDFNSHESRNAIPEARYLDALRADLEAALPLVWGRPVISVFIGGGTPSLFSPEGIDRLLGEEGQNTLRAKGIIDVSGEDRRLVFQAVHMILEGDLQREWGRLFQREAPTMTDAAALAETAVGLLAQGVTLHVSGCVKACGHPAAADLTLVGRDGRYDVVLNGTTRDKPIATLDLSALLTRLQPGQDLHARLIVAGRLSGPTK